MPCPISRPSPPSQNSASHSLYARTLAVLERPEVAVVGVQHLWCAVAPPLRNPRLPEIGWLVHMRVGVDDRYVDVEHVGEVGLHPSPPLFSVNIGTTTDRSGTVG